MKKHNKYMKMCFNLARKGEGKTSPNPLVGAVLVDEKGDIAAKGWHKGYGLDHAEVDCIKNYEKKYGENVNYKGLTLYVNLEPCNHYGKTPPCADFIIQKGIKRVVIAALDPNPKHTGGAEKLEKAGVEVIKNVLKDDAIKLNETFFKNVLNKKPFIAIKTASTLDGKIATKTGSSKWITSAESREVVQNLRNKYDAILTSSSTVIKDNPSLTARGKGYRNPVRIVFDSKLKTNPSSKVYNNDTTRVLLLYEEGLDYENSLESYPPNVKLIKVKEKDNKIDLEDAVNKIYLEGINSILVEAGGILCGEFLKQDFVDKIYQFIAPKILGDSNAKSFVDGFEISGINECRNFEIAALKNLNPDILLELYPKKL